MTLSLPLPLLLLSLAAGDAAPAELFDAIRMVESGGNDREVGDGGRSRGPLQCQRAAWAEGCKAGGVAWSYDRWVWDRDRSWYVWWHYTGKLGARTAEERCRAWVAGPRWRTRARVDSAAYWKKVKRVLDLGSQGR